MTKTKLLFMSLILILGGATKAVADDNTYNVNTYAGITNADFSSGNLNGWSHSGFTYNGGTWGNGGHMNQYAEKWASGTLNNYAIWRNTTAIMPAGTYTLTFNYNGAVGNKQETPMTGVTAFCGGHKQSITTINATTAQTFTMTFTTTEARYFDLGVELSSTTNANWIILDDFQLLWNGTEGEFNNACNALPTTASITNPIDYSNRVTNFGTHRANSPGWSKISSNGGGNCEFVSVIGDQAGFVYWNSSVQSNADLIYQDVTLPAGAYTLQADAAATVWNNNNGGENKRGCYVFAGTSDTEITSATYSTYTFGFTLAEAGTVRIGIKSKTNEGNNWCFLSNVKLTYLGQAVTIDEKQTTYTAATGMHDVALTRTLTANAWNTFVVPFAITGDELKTAFGDDVAVAEYSETADGDNSNVSFNTMTTPAISANVPVLLKPTTVSGDATYTFTNRTIEEGTPTVAGSNNFDFVGTYTTITYLPEGTYFLGNGDNKLYKTVASTTTLKGTRAYIAPRTTDGARIANFFIDGDQTTAIEGLAVDESAADHVYDLQGRRMAKGQLRQGLYIKGGKKFIVK
jgi:hypothetical protein